MSEFLLVHFTVLILPFRELKLPNVFLALSTLPFFLIPGVGGDVIIAMKHAPEPCFPLPDSSGPGKNTAPGRREFLGHR